MATNKLNGNGNNKTGSVDTVDPSDSHSHKLSQRLKDTRLVKFTKKIEDKALTGQKLTTIQIRRVTTDTYAGTTAFFSSFGKEPNLDFLADELADNSVRREVISFFKTRAIAEIIKLLITRDYFSPGQPKFTKTRMYSVSSAYGKSKFSDAAVTVACNIVAPGLIACGLLADEDSFAVRKAYKYERATAHKLRASLQMADLKRQIEHSTYSIKIDGTGQVTTAVLAERIGDIFLPVARILSDAVMYGDIFDDMLLGCRASLDPLGQTLATSVSRELYERPEIDEMVQNWTYVKAALELNPGTKPKRTYELHNKYMPLVLSMLKSDERFVEDSRAEFCGSYDIQQIRDSSDDIVTAVFSQSARMDCNVMSVNADADEVSSLAWNVRSSSDPVGDRLAAALGSVNDPMSINSMANLVTDILRTAVVADGRLKSAGSVTGPLVDSRVFRFVLDTENVDDIVTTYAVLNSDDLDIRFERSGDTVDFTTVYNIEKRDRHYIPKSGVVYGDNFKVSDPNEYILLSGDTRSTHQLQTLPQTIDPAVFDTRLVGITKDLFVSIHDKFSFYASIGGIKLSGRFIYGQIVSLMASTIVQIVKPTYNTLVASTSTEMFAAVDEYVKSLATGSDQERALVHSFTSDLAFFVNSVTASLGLSYRAEMRKEIINRCVEGLSYQEGTALRSRLSSQSLTTLIDLQSLGLVLARTGLLPEDEASFLAYFIENNEAAKMELMAIGRRSER